MKDIYLKLDELRNKGAAWQSEHKADKILGELKSILPDEEHYELRLSIWHYRNGEGSEEFYDVVNKLISKYRQDQYEKPKRTLL
jgi:hypothetical protein